MKNSQEIGRKETGSSFESCLSFFFQNSEKNIVTNYTYDIVTKLQSLPTTDRSSEGDDGLPQGMISNSHQDSSVFVSQSTGEPGTGGTFLKPFGTTAFSKVDGKLGCLINRTFTGEQHAVDSVPNVRAGEDADAVLGTKTCQNFVNTTFDFKNNQTDGTVTGNRPENKKCFNTTFEKDNLAVSTTFEKNPGLGKRLVNMTFEKANTTFDKANTTFDKVNTTFGKGNTTFEKVNTTFDKQPGLVNTTFDKEQQLADTDSKLHNVPVHEGLDPISSACDDSENPKLNVTFEGGEYKIASLNESVNLMDAEGEVLQLILDSTPQKASKIAPGASSTPINGSYTPVQATKRTVSLFSHLY